VYWDLRGKASPLTPSGIRDSIQNAQRQRAREDSTRAANSARDTVNARGQNPGTDTTVARGPRGGGRRGGPGGGGADQINLRPAEEQLGAGGGGRGGRGGFGGGNRAGAYVEEGDYLVTVTVAGRTMKQVVHVERVGEVGSDDPFGGDDDGGDDH